jgi:HEAT repeat protein
MPDPETCGLLVTALSSDPDDRVRAAAAEALGTAGTEDAIAPLVAVLKGPWRMGGAHETEIAAAKALARLRSPLAFRPMLDAMAHSDEYGGYEIKQEIRRALLDTVQAENVTALIHEMENVRYFGVAVTAVELLGAIGDRRAVDPLMRALRTVPQGDSAFELRLRLVEALGKLCDPRALAPLVKALEDSAPAVREASVEALGKLGGDRAEKALLAVLKDERINKNTVYRALDQIRGARPPLGST